MTSQRRDIPDGAVMPTGPLEQGSRPRKVAPDRRLVLLLITVLVALTLWNLRPTDPEGSYTSVEEVADLRLRMFLTASTVNAYHDSAGRFPPSLDVMEANEDGITYYPDEVGYILVGVSGETTIEYLSADDINILPPGHGRLPGETAS